MSSRLGPQRRILEQLLEEGRDQGVYSVAVALVGLKGDLLWQVATGRVSRDPDSPPATPATIFDLASLHQAPGHHDGPHASKGPGTSQPGDPAG